MKKYILLLTILQLITQAIYSQKINDYNERTFLSTDRNIYVTGDKILFSSYLINSTDTKEEPISKIIYIELISPNGKQVVGKKFLVKKNTVSGSIDIPTEILTGNYYLRSYTRFMRNCGPECYAYSALKIVNPHTKDLANSFNTEKSNLVSEIIDTTELYNFNFKKSEFKCREQVEVILHKKTKKQDIVFQTVSIALENSIIKHKNTLYSDNNYSLKYLPESRGISLSGILVDSISGERIKYHKVNLSIIKENGNEFYSTISDTVGRFYINFPAIYKDMDIFISTAPIEGSKPQILVDNDFCTNEIDLPNPLFKLNKDEKELAIKLTSNVEVNHHFYVKESIATDSTKQNENQDYFYGIPSGTLDLSEYIDLPTLHDYFTELPFLVKLKKVKGKNQFNIMGNHPELLIYEPLVMIDMVPIYDIDAILAIEPKDIKKIDVITAPYMLGNIIYGGIINFISKNNNMAGIDLPETGIFLNYSFLDNNSVLDSEKYNSDMPDPSNQLLWLTFLEPSVTPITLNFSTPDTPGVYSIIVKSYSKNGEVYFSSGSFIVK